MNKSEALVEGTTITKDRMAAMMAHSAALTGGSQAPLAEDTETVDHRLVAANLSKARPNLLDDINTKLAKRRKTEGVGGTSPSPGQDNIAYIPPTTSMVTNPGVLGGEDAEEEVLGEPPEVEHPNDKKESRQKDVDYLFAESDHEDDEDDEDEESDDEDGDKDGDKDDESTNESVELHCEKCGYEDEYNLAEAETDPPPMTADGQLDTRCPMCGGDMDYSLVGATDQEKVTDPTPFTDPRGNEGPATEAVHYARSLVSRVVAGESVETLANEVVESDFLRSDFRFVAQ